MTLRSICVFCGASTGAQPIYRQAAEKLGRHLAEQGLRACEKTLAYCDRLQTPAADVALREKQGHLAH